MKGFTPLVMLGQDTLSKALMAKNKAKLEESVIELTEDQICEALVVMYENLGAFKGLDKNLLRPFTSMYGYGHKQNTLSPKLGKDSEFKEVIFKNANDLTKLLVSKKDEFAGYVLKVDGTTVLTVGATWGSGYKSSDDIRMAFDSQFLSTKLDIKDANTWSGKYGKKGLLGPKNMAHDVIEAAKEKKLSVSGFFVTFDKNRMAAQGERKKAQAGAIAMMSPDAVRKLYRTELYSKLSAFKLTKNEATVATKEEVQKILEGKFPKTFSIKSGDDEVFYKLERVSNIDSAVAAKISGEKQSNFWSGASVEYRITPESDGKYSKLLRDLPDYKEVRDEWLEKFPRQITVAVKIDDNFAVKPDTIKYEKNWW